MPPGPSTGLFLPPHVLLIGCFSMTPCFSGLLPSYLSGIFLLKTWFPLSWVSVLLFMKHVFRSFFPPLGICFCSL